MNAMKNKIESQKGASITFALLLFLVCSVVSIVVVVAGSAAAGRMSERAETDQRYYAVTSAVELLCDDFKGMKVTVEYSAKVGETPSESAFEVTGISDGNGSSKNVKDPEVAVLAAVSQKLAERVAGLEPQNETYTLTTDAPTGSLTACTINEYIFKDGRAIFEVFNTDVEGATKQNKYTLQAVFDANIAQSKSQYTKDGNQMERVITTLTWSVDSIKKGAK